VRQSICSAHMVERGVESGHNVLIVSTPDWTRRIRHVCRPARNIACGYADFLQALNRNVRPEESGRGRLRVCATGGWKQCVSRQRGAETLLCRVGTPADTWLGMPKTQTGRLKQAARIFRIHAVRRDVRFRGKNSVSVNLASHRARARRFPSPRSGIWPALAAKSDRGY
jgi:hypothetical protein